MSRATLGQSLTGLSIVLPLAYCLVRAARLRLGGSRARERHGAAAGGSAGARAETSLDPPDAEGWAELRAEAHALLDASLDRMQSAREGRVWTPMPEQMRAELAGASPPSVPVGRTELASRLKALLPYGVGNTHPRFFGWVHGSGCPGVVLPELVAAAMNANCGGRDHAGVHVERQVLGWCKTLMGFPADAGGLLVSGTSMATLIALKVARDHCCAHASRAGGVVAAGRLCGYTSDQAHSCLSLAFDVLGMGSAQLRQVATGAESFEMDLVALADAVAADRRAGLVPFFVAGTAGTVSVGAVDDLDAIADFCRREQLWFHVDGAFGAAAVLSPLAAPRLSGLRRADSLAFDFHKWLHVAYDAGCVLVRDGDAHIRSFYNRPDYLLNNLSGADGSRERGIAAGRPWPTDFGPELSRGFRALKVWSHFLEHGTHALGATITANLELAALLARRVDAHPRLRRLAPAALNIVVFRYEPPRLASPSEGGAAQPGQRAAPRGDSPRTASRKTQAAAYDAVGGLAAAGAIGSLPAGTLRHGSFVTSSGRKASPMGARSTPVPSPGSTLLTSDAAVGAVSHTLRRDASAPVNAAVRSGSPALLPRNGAEPGSGREGVVWACSGDSDSPHGDHSPATPSGKLIGAVQLNGSRFVSPSAARACVDEEVGAAGSSRQAVAELEAALDSLNDAIVVELQERGIAAPSTARVRGRLAIRVNLTNHRTREEDLDILLRAVCGIGAELAPSWPEGALVAQ